MGIPGFNTWFSEEHRDAYIPLSQVRVDHLYIDMNSVLHTVMRRATSWDHYHKRLHKVLNSVLETTKPSKTVMLAVDGPGPLAKLLTQRDRRKKGGKAVEEGTVLHGTAITPGTLFMQDLTLSLNYFICAKMTSRKYQHLQFELSDGTVKGEGEVKILGRMNRHWHPWEADDTHVILGDDADLILMALVGYRENLFLINSRLDGDQGQLSPDTRVFAVNLLHQHWLTTLLQGMPATQSFETALLGVKMDLTLIAIICNGNDYLPPIRGLNMTGGGPERGLWPVYKTRLAASLREGVRPIVSLDPEQGLPRVDLQLMVQLAQTALGLPMDDSLTPATQPPSAQEWLGPNMRHAGAQHYLRGIAWMLQMYAVGECPDYRFYYDGAGPSASAFITACLSHGSPYLTLQSFTSDPNAGRPLLPYMCALALLPAQCRHLAPGGVQHLMDPLNGPLADVFDSCVECSEIAGQQASAQRGIQALQVQEKQLLPQLLAAKRKGQADRVAQLQAEMDAIKAQWDKLKVQAAKASAAYQVHYSRAHPYAPFPVERLESAASAVPMTAFAPAERSLTTFGQSTVFSLYRASTSGSSGQQWGRASRGRGLHTAAGRGRGGGPGLGLFVPPPPPFEAGYPCNFPPVLRQLVSNDDFGSPQAVYLAEDRHGPSHTYLCTSASASPESGAEGSSRPASAAAHGAKDMGPSKRARNEGRGNGRAPQRRGGGRPQQHLQSQQALSPRQQLNGHAQHPGTHLHPGHAIPPHPITSTNTQGSYPGPQSPTSYHQPQQQPQQHTASQQHQQPYQISQFMYVQQQLQVTSITPVSQPAPPPPMPSSMLLHKAAMRHSSSGYSPQAQYKSQLQPHGGRPALVAFRQPSPPRVVSAVHPAGLGASSMQPQHIRWP